MSRISACAESVVWKVGVNDGATMLYVLKRTDVRFCWRAMVSAGTTARGKGEREDSRRDGTA